LEAVAQGVGEDSKAASVKSDLAGLGIRIVFALLFAFAIFPPFIPIAGPLSADDLLPLIGASLGIAALLFTQKPVRFDATVIGFVVLGVCCIVSSVVNASSTSELGRLLGRSFGRALFYLSVVMTTRGMLDTRKLHRWALWLFIAAATGESLFSIWAYATRYYGPYGLGVSDFGGWSVLKGSVRAQGTFSGELTSTESATSSANFLAAYLVMSIPVTVGVALQVKRPRLQMVIFLVALVQAVTLYLTYTRAALAALGVTILAIGFFLEKKKLAVGILVMTVLLTFAIPSMRAKILDEGNDRKALYDASMRITEDHALAGIGDGRYDAVLMSDRRYYNTPHGFAETTSHNSILLSAANHGIAGGFAQLLLYVLLTVVTVRSLRRISGADRFIAAGIAAAILGYLAQDQLNNLAYIPKIATQMWFLFGILTSMALQKPQREVPVLGSSLADAED
jgi:hypothetical protein